MCLCRLKFPVEFLTISLDGLTGLSGENDMDRRQFLNQSAGGFGALALAGMLEADGLLADTTQPGGGAAVPGFRIR